MKSIPDTIRLFKEQKGWVFAEYWINRETGVTDRWKYTHLKLEEDK